VAEADARLRQAWELSYLDPLAARDIGRRVVAEGGPRAPEGWLHVALCEARVGDATVASSALQQARNGFAADADTRGLVLCDEVSAIQLRRRGDFAGSARLQAQVDARPERPDDAIYRFMAHNSRAITCKALGQFDEALRHFYAGRDAAAETGWAGPRITATSNLGGYHHTLFNLDDARRLSEDALRQAREAGARQIVGTSASNLIIIYYAAGEPAQARAMTEFMVTHAHELLPGALEHCALSLALGHFAVGEIAPALRYLDAGAVLSPADGDRITFWAWLKAGCLLAQGDARGAREVAERTLAQRRAARMSDPPFDMIQLHRVLADACEAGGDVAAALAYMRQTHSLYERLVGRSARARYIALEVGHQLTQAQRERDMAVDSHRSVEDDRRRLVELNLALQAQAAETERLHNQLREQALRDPLTGLHNRRYLFETAPGLLELARRSARPLCVVLLDLDHFKLLNDTYGHHAGDLVLQRFSALLTEMLRRSDVVCRHGGEEFVAVMPDIDVEGAQLMLGRLLEVFQKHQPELGRRRLPGGSFSAGVAQFPRHGSTLEQLLSRADRALYAAKNRGRSRIEPVPQTGFGTLT
jgi:diguanylate cyclase (GGDEF)-like protein